MATPRTLCVRFHHTHVLTISLTLAILCIGMKITKNFFNLTSLQLLLAVFSIFYLIVFIPLVDVKSICGHTICAYQEPITIMQYLLTSPKSCPQNLNNWYGTCYSYQLNFRLLLEILTPLVLSYLLICAVIALYGKNQQRDEKFHEKTMYASTTIAGKKQRRV